MRNILCDVMSSLSSALLHFCYWTKTKVQFSELYLFTRPQLNKREFSVRKAGRHFRGNMTTINVYTKEKKSTKENPRYQEKHLTFLSSILSEFMLCFYLPVPAINMILRSSKRAWSCIPVFSLYGNQ